MIVDALKAIEARPKLIEIKHRIGKPVLKFPLENWMVDDQVCVGRWVQTNDASYGSPVGGYSWGVWWTESLQQGKVGVGAYRIHDNFGNLIAYRLDILKNTKINKNTVEFTDLIMDAYLWPQEVLSNDICATVDTLEVTVEDEDELEQLESCGDVSASEGAVIRSVIKDVISHPSKYRDAVDTAIDTAKNKVS